MASSEVVLDAPNILLQTHMPLQDTVKYNMGLREFVKLLARKNPSWKFIATSSWGHPLIQEFNVYYYGETLGKIGSDNVKGVPRYWASNDNIRISRSRGSIAKSVDMKKVLKVIKEHFRGKSDTEIAMNSNRSVINEVRNDRSTYTNEVDECATALYDQIRDLIISKPETFAQWVTNPAIIRNIHIARERHEAYESVAEADVAHSIVIKGGDYYMFDDWESSPRIYKGDTLPGWVKRKVGLLKIIEDDTYIKDIGFRSSDGIYRITGENVHADEHE